MKTIYTIGHSTRSFDQFASVLSAHGIRRLVDVRRFPRSRHNPHFNKESLEAELPGKGIRYLWLGELLGGFRKSGYNEYTKTKEFEKGLAALELVAEQETVAVMCAEILWFKCHRARIAQKLFERGWRVVHIYDEKRADEHRERGPRKKTAEEDVSCPECGHDCLLERGEPYCPVCFPEPKK